MGHSQAGHIRDGIFDAFKERGAACNADQRREGDEVQFRDQSRLAERAVQVSSAGSDDGRGAGKGRELPHRAQLSPA